MKDVALVGLPFSGKSTVWEAVARSHAQAPHAKASVGVVKVPDPRLDRLTEIESSKKITHSQLRLVDVPGLDPQALGEARGADALGIVLRGFGDDADPVRDLATFRAELALADLQTMEKVIDRVRRKAKTGEEQARRELPIYERAEGVLSDDRWLSEERWEPEEHRTLALLTPLTLKPALHVVNADESGTEAAEVPEPKVVIRGLLEAEAAELDEDEAADLLSEYGVTESATARFIRSIYDMLDLVTFLTAGPTESRAWEIPRGATAPQAAGAIHSDLERGFIRAEVVGFDVLDELGSWDAAKSAGKLRLEGKDYVVAEGDVMLIRHAT